MNRQNSNLDVRGNVICVDIRTNYRGKLEYAEHGNRDKGKRVILKVFPYYRDDRCEAVTRYYSNPFTIGYLTFKDITINNGNTDELDVNELNTIAINGAREWLMNLKNTELAGMLDDFSEVTTLSVFSFNSYGVKWESVDNYHICTVYVSVNEDSFKALRLMPGTSTWTVTTDVDNLEHIVHDAMRRAMHTVIGEVDE